MTVSAIRTITLSTAPRFYRGVRSPPPPRWPIAQPGDDLDYSLDITAYLTDAADVIQAVAVDTAPSGTGEWSATDLQVAGSVVTLRASGGIPGRVTTARVAVTTLTGREWQFLAEMLIDPRQTEDPIPDPPSDGYGTPLTWTSGAVVFGSFAAVAEAIAAGTTQADATLLTAQTNIITAGAADTGVQLPDDVVSGTIKVLNRTPTDKFVYPPDGQQIEDAAANVATIVSSFGSAEYTITAGSDQWFAS